jgi:hypothetical protein
MRYVELEGALDGGKLVTFLRVFKLTKPKQGEIVVAINVTERRKLWRK